MKKISYLTLVSFILLSGCANQSVSPTTDSKTSGNSEYETISGIAEETKDGYYLDGNVLEHNVIEKYHKDNDNEPQDYSGKIISVVGKIKEIDSGDCTNEAGEIVQCRPGKSTYIYDIQSIKNEPAS